MKRHNEIKDPSDVMTNGAHLIEQLRRDTGPHYFPDDDKRQLSESIHKIVGDALKKK
ncbi:MAG: hypothetical protein PF508_08770 [Spirochaeta sp.]|jgi:hypothetical protein|nr:hypothetical protein [Spirochaeta sp.]